MKQSDKGLVRQPSTAYAVFAAQDQQEKKYAWIAAVVSAVVLLLSWWARSSR